MMVIHLLMVGGTLEINASQNIVNRARKLLKETLLYWHRPWELYWSKGALQSCIDCRSDICIKDRFSFREKVISSECLQ